MDQEPKQQAKRLTPLTLVLIIIIVLLVAAAAVLAVSKFGGEQLEPAPVASGGDGTPKLGYQEGVTAIDDASKLEEALKKKKELADEGGVPVTFANDAESTDGTNIDCYLGNPDRAKYDVYYQIFADAEMTDQLYLSGLVPPGSVLQQIELERALETGDHRVYVAVTQVEDDHATIHAQTYITMDFHVSTK